MLKPSRGFGPTKRQKFRPPVLTQKEEAFSRHPPGPPPPQDGRLHTGGCRSPYTSAKRYIGTSTSPYVAHLAVADIIHLPGVFQAHFSRSFDFRSAGGQRVTAIYLCLQEHIKNAPRESWHPAGCGLSRPPSTGSCRAHSSRPAHPYSLLSGPAFKRPRTDRPHPRPARPAPAHTPTSTRGPAREKRSLMEARPAGRRKSEAPDSLGEPEASGVRN